MDLFSYLMGKQAGGGITPTGTINITENGTVDVTNYATANVNVSGGVTPAPTMKGLRTALDAAEETFRTVMASQRNSYSAYSNEAVTLYSPYQYCDYYVIRKRSNGKYQIIWTYHDCWIRRNNSYFFTCYPQIQRWGSNPASPASLGNDTNLIENRTGFSQDYINCSFKTTGSYYYSQNFDTLELAVSAIQSSSTTYTASSDTIMDFTADTGHIVPCTNAFVFEDSGDKPLISDRIISKNETIQYIS